MPILIQNLDKSYGQKTIFSDFSYCFEQGKTYCLSGRSGAGKTTLLRLIMGLEEPDGGRIDFIGMDRSLAPVFQEDRLLLELSVWANLKVVCPYSLNREQALTLLEAMGIGDTLSQPAAELSGGMKRRLALARSLLSQRDILLWDEPFNGMDARTKFSLIEKLPGWIGGKTLIWVSHDPLEREAFGGIPLKIGQE